MKLGIRDLLVLALTVLTFGACSKKETGSAVQIEEANTQRQNPELASPQTAKVIEENAFKNEFVRVGLLYYQDSKTHRKAILKWLEDNAASVEFESEKLGYLDTKVKWSDLSQLMESRGSVGLSASSVMKLEIDRTINPAPESVSSNGKPQGNSNVKAGSKRYPAKGPTGERSFAGFLGEVHSAGYGMNLKEFRQNSPLEFGSQLPFSGAGTKVGVFDSGLDFSRIDVFNDRLVGALVGDVNGWQDVDIKLKPEERPPGIEKVADNTSLAFLKLNEADFNFDLNNSGSPKDSLLVASYEFEGKYFLQIQPSAGLPFGPPIPEFGTDHISKTIFDPSTGRPYKRQKNNPSAAALAFQIQKAGPKIKVAFLGDPSRGQHGIANLHMVGGRYQSAPDAEVYQGVAPETQFIHMQTWSRSTYGNNWLSLARSIALGTEHNLDVLDLDIYVPGVRGAEDMLSALLCRVVRISNTVPIVAAHNYGPLPQSIQNLAESPCILTVGASHSRQALLQGYQSPKVGSNLVQPEDVITANYSGRGFATNGLLKPDIISPAYAYTAYGQEFTRFGGTSGATPTTVGAVVLLKEAARKLGTEIDFFQTRMLLQSGSRVSQNPREGYGFTDLYNTAKILKTLHSQQQLNAIWISGQKLLSWSERPERHQIQLQLKRELVPNGINSPRPMRVWIEDNLPALGAAGKINWVSLSDANGNPMGIHKQNEATIEIPMEGEKFALQLIVGISETEWAGLPSGDYVSVIKMVREELAGTGAVDFVMPIAVQKPVDIFYEKILPIKALHAEEIQYFYFQSEPGESFSVAGNFVCVDKSGQAIDFVSSPTQVYMYVDPVPAHDHASEIMSGYSGFRLTNTPMQFTSERWLVPFAISRNRKDGDSCPGALKGSLWVRKVNPRTRASDPRVSTTKDLVTMQSTLEASLYRALTKTSSLELKVQSTEIIASNDFTNDANWSSSGSSKLTARAGHGAFPMILAKKNKESNWIEVLRSQMAYQDGINPPDPILNPETAGNLEVPLPPGSYQIMSTCPVKQRIKDCLRIKLSFPVAAETRITRLSQNAKILHFQSQIRREVLDTILKELGPGWNLQIVHALVVKESQTGAQNYGVGFSIQETPAGTLSFPL